MLKYCVELMHCTLTFICHPNLKAVLQRSMCERWSSCVKIDPSKPKSLIMVDVSDVIWLCFEVRGH